MSPERRAQRSAAINAHPLSHFLRAAAPGAPNAATLLALADAVDAADTVDAAPGAAGEALRWFDATVRLVGGRYEPCAPVRRRLRNLTAADDAAQTIARLAAEELATRAVIRESRGANRR
ncbi:MAG: hypothetical protein JWP17_2087 [Solirubrobacterales bacterium]|nr:hypothetical protein [Solirubrobacterales bacterium]